jgi:hypothetical protein
LKICNKLQRTDVQPNHRLVSPFLSSKSLISWGYESKKRRWFLRLYIVPSHKTNYYNHSNPPYIFPLNLHKPRNGIPFSATQSLELSHFPLELQLKLAMKSLCWGLWEFTVATIILIVTTHFLNLKFSCIESYS